MHENQLNPNFRRRVANEIAEQGAPAAKGDGHRGTRAEIFMASVDVFDRFVFRGVGPEDAVVDDQDSAEIFVEILRVIGVMHAMIRRRVEKEIQPLVRGKKLRMHEPLVFRIEKQTESGEHRREAEPKDGHREDEEERKRTGETTGSQSGRKVEEFRRVMDAVGCPPQADRV